MNQTVSFIFYYWNFSKYVWNGFTFPFFVLMLVRFFLLKLFVVFSIKINILYTRWSLNAPTKSERKSGALRLRWCVKALPDTFRLKLRILFLFHVFFYKNMREMILHADNNISCIFWDRMITYMMYLHLFIFFTLYNKYWN